MYANFANFELESLAKLLALIGSASAVVVALYRLYVWLVKRIERQSDVKMINRVQAKFVHEVATNHLPHLYNSQVKIARGIKQLGAAQGLDLDMELEEVPPIRFVPYLPDKDVE
jgi:hypothetical protein